MSEDYKSSRRATPKGWKHARIVPIGSLYSVRTFMGYARFGQLDRELLLGDNKIQTEELNYQDAVTIGKRIEDRLEQIERSIRRPRRGKT